MSKVLVIDTDKRHEYPIHPARARQLLNNGRAAIFRRFPFTIILTESLPNQTVQPLRIKIDPGAKTTGIAVVNDTTGEVVWASVLQHRGFTIKKSLTYRRQLRRSRRNRNIKNVKPLLIKATGHGTRQSCRTDKYGFANCHCAREKIHFGFQTGDIVKALVTTGKKIGTYTGRIATRTTGSFNISTKAGLIQGISYRFCKIIHRKDGYGYAC
ncbi:MAG: RRXRR domain-containing protein [Rhizonema sp. NSF051]|nr:RRXRR domain-containing protein [Rhizonema sp. NSF051]